MKLTSKQICNWATPFYSFIKTNYSARFGFDLRGCCGIATWTFKELIERLNGEIDCVWGICHGKFHCWNVVKEDNSIIDLTYGQFAPYAKLPKITFCNKNYEMKEIVQDVDFFKDWYWQGPYVNDTASKDINNFLEIMEHNEAIKNFSYS